MLLEDALWIINPPRMWEENGKPYERDYNDYGINHQNFPPDPGGIVQTEVILCRQKRKYIRFIEALYELDAYGLRSATVNAFVENYGFKDLTKKKPETDAAPIAVLGSVWQDLDGRHYIVTFYNDSGVKRAHLDFAETGWYKRYLFAAVPGHDHRLDTRPATIKEYLSASREG